MIIQHKLAQLIFNLIKDKINKYRKINVAENILYSSFVKSPKFGEEGRELYLKI